MQDWLVGTKLQVSTNTVDLMVMKKQDQFCKIHRFGKRDLKEAQNFVCLQLDFGLFYWLLKSKYMYPGVTYLMST